jgi:hypothetical protein
MVFCLIEVDEVMGFFFIIGAALALPEFMRLVGGIAGELERGGAVSYRGAC